MKKGIVLFLGISLIVSGLVGCGGGGGGGGSPVGKTTGVVIAAALFTLLIVGTGGAAAPVAFAASVKEGQPASVRAAVSLAENHVFVRVTPFKNGSPLGAAIVKPTSALSVDGNGNIVCNVSMEATTQQYLVEIIASSAALAGQKTLLKKQVFAGHEIQDGEKIPATVDSSSTAYAMVYDSWLAKDEVPDKDYGTFEVRTAAKVATINTLATKVQASFTARATAMSGQTGAPTSGGHGGGGTAAPTSTSGPSSAAPSDASLEDLASQIADSI